MSRVAHVKAPWMSLFWVLTVVWSPRAPQHRLKRSSLQLQPTEIRL